ncbi:hypothetical protein ACHAW5_000621 [Stephanodiscus triporus]|uniref:AB hydrolase-1 domain-containing protein n=1 Tax=Stephanodiscus triporus TaxID=2934178 RepID=A0ABD3PQU4_9STRA
MGRHLGDRDASKAAKARTRDLDVCGHSFGSCQLTWMIKCARIGDRIGSLLLVDPVSILLSEPDVVTNFLYEGRRDLSGECSGWTTRWMLRTFHRVKIRLAVSSEIFIESYLRRNFAWCDIPRDVKVVVALADRDEIVNVPRIDREVDLHSSQRESSQGGTKHGSGGAFVVKIIWRDAGHAACIANPSRWSDIDRVMTRIELQISKEESMYSEVV